MSKVDNVKIDNYHKLRKITRDTINLERRNQKCQSRDEMCK